MTDGYIARYAFYKISYPQPKQPFIHSVELVEFTEPQKENTVTAEKRAAGYKTLRVNENIFNILLAVNAAKPL